MGRPSHWSQRFPLVLGMVLASLGLPVPAGARTFVLKADGSGDVATFQGGVDSLHYPDSFQIPPDTLRVMAGYYDEAVFVRRAQFRAVIVCPDGPNATRLRSLAVGFSNLARPEIMGLGVEDSLTVGGAGMFTGCVFTGPVSHSGGDDYQLDRYEHCEFRAPVRLAPFIGVVEGCTFAGAPLFLQPIDDPIRVHSCSFSGQDTALTFAFSDRIGAVVVDSCVFEHVGNAIIGLPNQSTLSIGISNSQFHDVRGTAIGFDAGFTPRGFSAGSSVNIGGCEFLDCGNAVRLFPLGAAFFGFRASSVKRATGSGLDIRAGELHGVLDNVQIEGCGGLGVEWKGIVEGKVTNCMMRGNALGGFKVTVAAWADTLRIVGSTEVINGGPALLIEPGDDWTGVELPLVVENNLLAGNAGGGLELQVPHAGVIRHNDVWMNPGGDFVGVTDLGPNLTLDPQFCDALAGDFHVASGSPCAPSGPFGQIGALGVGCDVSTVGIDIKPGSPANVVPPNSKGILPVAILSHRLFDARQVDPRSIRLAGASLAAQQPTQQRDVNGDGLTDLVAHVDVAGMRFAPGLDVAVLEAATFYGAPIRGSDRVVLAPSKGVGRFADAEDTPVVPALAIHRVENQGGHLLVSLSLPSSESAVLELFDLAGRRVDMHDIRDVGQGTKEVAVRVGGTGVYWLRLSQGARSLTRRVDITWGAP